MLLDDGIGIRLTKPPDAHGKSAGDSDDPDFPRFAGGLLKRKPWFCAWRFLEHAHESAHVLSGGCIAKPISARQCEHVARGTNHQFGLERQPAQDFVAQLRLAYILAHHKRSGRADIDDAERRQLFRQFAGLESLMSAHIDGFEENCS